MTAVLMLRLTERPLGRRPRLVTPSGVHLTLPVHVLVTLSALVVWLALVWVPVTAYLRLLDPRWSVLLVIAAVAVLVVTDHGSDRRVQATTVERPAPPVEPRRHVRADPGFWNLPAGQWRDEPERRPRRASLYERRVIASWNLPTEVGPGHDDLPF